MTASLKRACDRGERRGRRPGTVGALAGRGQWDAVVDTSGYVPRNCLQVAHALEPVVGRCVFMSTVSVYAGWPVEPLCEESPVLPCPPDAGPDYGQDTEDGPTRYGYQKCTTGEAAVGHRGIECHSAKSAAPA